MSFIPPYKHGSPDVEAEMYRQEQHEVEAAAERYSQLHGDDVADSGPGAVRRLLDRLRAAVHRRE